MLAWLSMHTYTLYRAYQDDKLYEHKLFKLSQQTHATQPVIREHQGESVGSSTGYQAHTSGGRSGGPSSYFVNPFAARPLSDAGSSASTGRGTAAAGFTNPFCSSKMANTQSTPAEMPQPANPFFMQGSASAGGAHAYSCGLEPLATGVLSMLLLAQRWDIHSL